MIKNFLITAWRTFSKYRSINLLNMLGLSTGMTAAILIFLWVQNERSYDSYHPGADRLYRVTAHITSAKWTWETSPFNLTAAIRSELPQVEAVTSFQSAYSITVHIGDELLAEKNAAYVDSAWFSTFHYDFLEGNAAAFFRDPFSLILTEKKAKKYFGDKDPIGRTIRIDTIDYRIAGIVKDIPSNSSFQFDVILPVGALLTIPDQRKYVTGWGNFTVQTFLKLQPGVHPEKIEAAITDIQYRNTRGQDNSRNTLSLTRLRDIHFENDLSSSGGAVIHTNRSTVTIFSVLGIFLLLIACINYVNLTTARASLRAKEVGIRKIVGAGKSSLFLQFIVESLMVSVISLLVTLLLIQLFMPVFRQLTDKQFPSPFILSDTWKILGITLLTTVILTGFYPALLISSFRPLNVLKGVSILKFKDAWLRRSLVVLQFTFSIILIIGTLIIKRQLTYIRQADPGYNRSQIFSVRLPGPSNVIKQELLEQPGVAAVTVASQSIVQLSTTNSGSADWDGHDKAFAPTVYELSADENYQKVLQLQMQQGRWFEDQNQMDGHNFILNETALRIFNLRKPVLGQRFSFQGDTGKIIGIVKDFHFSSLHEKINPVVILNKQSWRSTFFIKTTPGAATRVLAATRAIVSRHSPSKPFEYSFLDDQFDGLYKSDEKVSSLILIFSAIAILISCLGLFGLATFSASQKVREIGIRKVLGASVTDIVTLVSRDFVRLVTLSIVIAIPIAWWSMHRWLQEFAYHISLSAWVFLLGGAIALFIAVITVSAQSIKAAVADPIKNLRTE
jgi:putative ABC transport system permease protein